ncbi:hypothetical protein L195_g045076, partial [Trifolium pratense]
MYGCRWKIGNGANINIMHEPSLKKEDGLACGCLHLKDKVRIIFPLITWDRNKVMSLFPTEVANCILAVPLFDVVEENKLVWFEDSHGNYSVKSGYNMLLHHDTSTTVMAVPGNWKSLWKIHTPPKSKHLLWRICRECLPTRARLQERHVKCPEQFSTVKGVIMDVCSKEDRDVAGRMALLVWSLWNNRNNCVWNSIKEAGQQIGIKSE